jgi:hypothetical protein
MMIMGSTTVSETPAPRLLQGDIERWRRVVGKVYDELASKGPGADLAGLRIELLQVAAEMGLAMRGSHDG